MTADVNTKLAGNALCCSRSIGVDPRKSRSARDDDQLQHVVPCRFSLPASFSHIVGFQALCYGVITRSCTTRIVLLWIHRNNLGIHMGKLSCVAANVAWKTRINGVNRNEEDNWIRCTLNSPSKSKKKGSWGKKVTLYILFNVHKYWKPTKQGEEAEWQSSMSCDFLP